MLMLTQLQPNQALLGAADCLLAFSPRSRAASLARQLSGVCTARMRLCVCARMRAHTHRFLLTNDISGVILARCPGSRLCTGSWSISVVQCRQASCSVLQCVAVCCSVLQCVAVLVAGYWRCFSVCWGVLQRVAVCRSVLQCVAVLLVTGSGGPQSTGDASWYGACLCSTLKMLRLLLHCQSPQQTAVLQHITPHCTTLQHTATHSNTLQHATTSINRCRGWRRPDTTRQSARGSVHTQQPRNAHMRCLN